MRFRRRLPDFDAGGRQIVVQTFRLLARGEPVSPAAIAEAAGVPLEQAEESLRSWPAVFWDDQDRVVRFWGLAIDRLDVRTRTTRQPAEVGGGRLMKSERTDA